MNSELAAHVVKLITDDEKIQVEVRKHALLAMGCDPDSDWSARFEADEAFERAYYEKVNAFQVDLLTAALAVFKGA